MNTHINGRFQISVAPCGVAVVALSEFGVYVSDFSVDLFP